ncbi:MAG: small multi-drug export protein [Oscillospiraceae bacterium]
MSFIETLQQTDLGKVIITFFVSMLPILELRGAIPLGVGMGLGHWQAMLISVIGNMVPVPFIIIFIRKIFAWLRSKSPKLEHTVSNLEKKAEGKWDKVRKYELLGLTVLVAIPLPGTGAWTGALIAALMNIRMKYAVPCILLGVIIAGFLMTGITFGFGAIFS